jgi:hypothetical protein
VERERKKGERGGEDDAGKPETAQIRKIHQGIGTFRELTNVVRIHLRRGGSAM